MVNYNNGKIYKIESHIGDKVYIGSTTKEYLSQRMVKHRDDYKRWNQGKIRLTTSFLLFDEYGIENCSIVLLESCPCESKDELHARESHYIRTIKCVNKFIPDRTIKEYNEYYYEANKDKIKDKKKEYREANKDKINDKKKEYRDANKEEINRKRREQYAAKKLKKEQLTQ